MRGRGVKGQHPRTSGNPFLLSAEPARHVTSQQPSEPAAKAPPSNNPFFAAISKQVTSAPPPPPPSYASVVSGQGGPSVGPSAGPDAIFPPPGPSMGTGQPNNPFMAKPSNLISAPTLPSQSQGPVKSAVPLHTQSKQPRVAMGGNPFQPKSSSFPSGYSTTLHLKLLPPQVNTQEILEKHFSKFGRVENILCVAEEMSAYVTFTTHVSSLLFVECSYLIVTVIG